MMKKMKEVKVEIPPLLAGWHLMTRAGIPKWTHVQIKALCSGDLAYDKVSNALMKMFGADHKPNPKDLVRPGKEENFYAEFDDEGAYDHEDEYAAEWDDAFYEEEDAYYEEDEDDVVPSDLELAADQTEEAYISYVESRRRMKELALNRGFYPIVALGPDVIGGRGKGDGRSSKGKGKGKGFKGKGKSKGPPLRRTPMNRRPMSGLRRPTSAASSSSGASAPDIKSTLSGSTASHGPRFKRYRMASNGVKEVPEESISMVEEELKVEECLYSDSGAGMAIIDSGATRTIAGEEVWKGWIEEASRRELGLNVSTHQVIRDFKFGDGGVARSHYEVEFDAGIRGQVKRIRASIIAGRTPFLLARPTLEELGMKQNFGTGEVSVAGSKWFQPERGHKGHYMLNLFDYKEEDDENWVHCVSEEGTKFWDDERNPAWMIEPVMEKEVGRVERRQA